MKSDIFDRIASQRGKGKETVRGWDFGLFTYIYERLYPYFNVQLYTPYENAFPTSDRAIIGAGLKGIAKLEDFWTDKKNVDIFTFFDFYMGALQDDLREQGFAVFGPGKRGELLERDRLHFKKVLRDVKLPVIPFDICVGVNENSPEIRKKLAESLKEYGITKKPDELLPLREYLFGLPEGTKRIIKASCFRGDVETEPHEEYEDTKQWLDETAMKLGVQADEQLFICEFPIEGKCEPGRDDVISDGVFGTWGMVGWEEKGSALIGKWFKRESIPAILKYIDDALIPLFREYRYRGLYCMESRVSEKAQYGMPAGTCWPLDICTRAGSPSSEVLIKSIDNFPEVVKMVAQGKEPKIELKDQYAAILKFHTSRLSNNYDVPISYPKEIADSVMVRNKHVHGNGQIYSISQDKGDNAGAVVATGSTIDEACNKCLELIEQVKCKCMEYDQNAFDKIKGYMKEGERWKIDMT
ncbi:MAG TPA: hypothetical protein VF790_14005 [Dissulfurispiraceae bacterium]